MKIKAGSKLNKIVGFAMTHFKEDSLNQIVFSGSGSAVTKTVTCVEIMKRKHKNIHQITRIASKKIEETWEPKLEGLDRLKVVREIPEIHVLLSKTPLDQTERGYQQGKFTHINNSSGTYKPQSSRRPQSNRGRKRKKEM